MDDDRIFRLFDVLPDAILVVTSDGTIHMANQSAGAALYQPADSLPGRKLSELVSVAPVDLGAFLRICSRTADRVIGAFFVHRNGQSARHRVEAYLSKPKADSSPAEIVLRLLPAEATTGKFLLLNERIDQLSREVAARRRAEEDLRGERELLRVTLASIGDAVIVTDLQGRITFMNSVAEHLTGWPIFEVQGKAVEQVFRIVDAVSGDTVESPVQNVLREGKTAGLANHTILIAKDRTERPIDDSGAPIRDATGRIRGVVLVFRDVSERKRIEDERENMLQSERIARAEAEQAGRMKDEFLATLSHELRTPLNAILGYATLLQMGPSSESDVQDGLAVIAKNARAQAQLIEDLLDMNRIISGKVRLDVQVVQLANVIDAALETIRPSADAKGLRIRRTVDPLAGVVRGDPNRLQQVVWNLLSNAVKFTPKGGQIQVSLERVNSHVEIIVTDTGQGIDPDFLPNVFDRFRQADSSITRHHGGLGLGLSIVKQLVELHGGAVRAKSPGQDQGSTFVISLPLAVFHSDSSEASLSPQGVGQSIDCLPNLAGVRVLVVDDELDACLLVVKVLSDCNATVEFANSAQEALQKLQTPFDVLVSDIGMPGEDGYELLRKLRSLGPERGGAIPAIALTAFARSEDRRRAAFAGFQTHLAKPIEALELLAVVASLAGRTGK